MNKILIKRYERLQKLRSLAIEDRNITKKYQADRLIKEITNKLNHLANFSA